jgi:phosphoribosylformylglycinamidine (FGAM) synthase PurS component
MKTTKRQLKNLIKEEVLALFEAEETLDKTGLQKQVRDTSSSAVASSLSSLNPQEVELIQLLRQMQTIAVQNTGNQATNAVTRYLEMAVAEMAKLDKAGSDAATKKEPAAVPDPAAAVSDPAAAAVAPGQEEKIVEKIIQRLSRRSR